MPKRNKPPKNNRRTLAIVGAVRADDDKRSIELAFSSEAPVERWFGTEILDHSEGACDLSRLNGGGALLLNHDPARQIGVVDSARIDKDGIGRAVVRFSRAADADAVYQDVKDGIRRLVSVGYAVNEWLNTKGTNGAADTMRATKWMPYEISMVAIPADTTVGVGRSKRHEDNPDLYDEDYEREEKPEGDESDDESRDDEPEANAEGDDDNDESREDDDTADDDSREEDDESTPPPAKGEKQFPKAGKNNRNIKPTITMPAPVNAAVNPAEKEIARVREIAAIGQRFNIEAKVTEQFIRENKSVREFQDIVLNEQEKRHSKPIASLGMSDKEVKRFSIVRAMASLMTPGGKLDGIEREACDAMAKALGRDAKGFFIPVDVLRASRRDLSVGAPTAGGNTVETMVDGANLIELLRNKMVTTSLGVRTISGVKGNLAIPSQTGGATAQWLTEAQVGTRSAQAVGQVVMTPKHLQGATAYSKQLLSQSSIDVEAFVRDDLMAVLALAKDLAVLGGTGSGGQPTGIAYTAGIGSVTFGAAATYAKIQAFETAVENANALLGTPAYVTTPNSKASWKAKNRFANTFSPLWGDDNTVNGYKALSTKQMATINAINDAVIFGNFADAIVADWDGFDVVVDPFSLSLNNQVSIVIHHMTDVGIRHAGSFAMSTDSGAQ